MFDMPLLSELSQTSQDLSHNGGYNGTNPGTFVLILQKVAFFSAQSLRNITPPLKVMPGEPTEQ